MTGAPNKRGHLNLGALEWELRKDRARPYWEAYHNLGDRLDQMPTDDPDRPRLVALRQAARTRAEVIERGSHE